MKGKDWLAVAGVLVAGITAYILYEQYVSSSSSSSGGGSPAPIINFPSQPDSGNVSGNTGNGAENIGWPANTPYVNSNASGQGYVLPKSQGGGVLQVMPSGLVLKRGIYSP